MRSKEIKQEKHQREEQESASPAKKARSESFEMEDFNFADDGSLEDIYGESPDLKVSPPKIMKPNTEVEEKHLKLKEDDRVKGKEESEEPPKWFATFAATVTRIEKKLNTTMEEVDDLKGENVEEMPQMEEVQMTEKDENGISLLLLM